jgi:hypothetical protein
LGAQRGVAPNKRRGSFCDVALNAATVHRAVHTRAGREA